MKRGFFQLVAPCSKILNRASAKRKGIRTEKEYRGGPPPDSLESQLLRPACRPYGQQATILRYAHPRWWCPKTASRCARKKKAPRVVAKNYLIPKLNKTFNATH